jgi:hypothetical protein
VVPRQRSRIWMIFFPREIRTQHQPQRITNIYRAMRINRRPRSDSRIRSSPRQHDRRRIRYNRRQHRKLVFLPK